MVILAIHFCLLSTIVVAYMWQCLYAEVYRNIEVLMVLIHIYT